MQKICLLVCGILIICSLPLQGLIILPNCPNTYKDKAFQIAGFYFWIPCGVKSHPEAKTFCSNAGGWLNEPKTQEIVDNMKSIILGGSFYFQGLEKIYGRWTWDRGGDWDNENPPRVGYRRNFNCSIHAKLVWRDHNCTFPRRYICQFPACSDNRDCNEYEDCVTNNNDNSKNTLKFCTCKGGYSGVRCTDQFCSPTCKDNQICTYNKGYSTYSCQCKDGYYGYNCENQRCASNCTGNRICFQDQSSNYSCRCINGYYGDDCNSNYCTANPGSCGNGATCNSNLGIPSYSCNCSPGFYGKNCTVDYCTGNANPCKNQGTCTSRIGTPGYTCDCSPGFSGKICDDHLIKVSSPENQTGVEMENLTIQLVVTTFDGPVTIKVTKNNANVDTISDIRNETVNYTISGVQKSDNKSTYIFIASPESGSYTRETNTTVFVHVRAYVNASGITSIYAPQADNEGCERTVACTFGGIPSPTVYGWYHNGERLDQSERLTVYQTIDGDRATLYARNGILADHGDYKCYASNIVANEKNISEAETHVTLLVYSPPVEVNPRSKPCTDQGEITVDWTAGSKTNSVNHTFRISQLGSSTTYDDTKTSIDGDQVIFSGLTPSTDFQIYVEVCPETNCCISKLSKTVNVTTGHGLPGNIPSKMNMSGTTICAVFWNASSTPINGVEGYNITWIAKVRDKLFYEVEDINGQDYVNAPRMNYSIPTQPNKNYSVRVSARTCTGNGNFINATGDCWTPIEGPDHVPPPILDKALDGVRQETRRIKVQMVNDESNGAISCLFLILYKNNVGKLPKSFTDLQQLSSNAIAERSEAGYIAVAINRRELEIGNITEVEIGNGLTTSCDAFLTGMISPKQNDPSNFIEAKNIPLDYRGVTYRLLSVTTTPGSDGQIIVTYNKDYETLQDLPSFIQGSSLVWVAACVLAPVLIIVAVVLLRIRRKRNATKKWSERNPVFDAEEFAEPVNEALYENIEVTIIPLASLKEQYLQMAADDGLRFLEQFTKLKQEAKKTAASWTYASSDQIMKKNRYRNILPYDSNRVCLKEEGPNDYINASYVKGSSKLFIATQGPLPHTIAEFWRMIVEHGCRIIVMLTKCKENDRVKCERYWPEARDEVQHGPYRIRNIDEKICGGIVKTVLKVRVHDKEEKAVTHYQYVRWPDHGVPQTTTTFFRLHKQVMREFRNTNEEVPIVVHCSAGVGRTGTFIGFDLLLGESDQDIDVYKCVMEMRKQRVDMVQTSEQYQMLHKLMMEQYSVKETDLARNEWLESTAMDEMTSNEFVLLGEFDTMNSEEREFDEENAANVIIVKQADETESVHFDATFVEAFADKVHFIASEGPTNSTVEYFLRALWDNGVDEIIMLNDPNMEDDQGQFCEYWSSELRVPVTYNSITITLQSSNERRGSTERIFYLERLDQQPRTIIQHQIINWKSEQDPEHADLLIDLIRNTIDNGDQANDATVLVHCTDGLRRTGVFIAVANIIARLESESRIDVVRTVKDLRDIRPGMVKTISDYQCCYHLAKQFVMQQSVYENETFQSDKANDCEDPIYQNLSNA